MSEFDLRRRSRETVARDSHYYGGIMINTEQKWRMGTIMESFITFWNALEITCQKIYEEYRKVFFHINIPNSLINNVINDIYEILFNLMIEKLKICYRIRYASQRSDNIQEHRWRFKNCIFKESLDYIDINCLARIPNVQSFGGAVEL